MELFNFMIVGLKGYCMFIVSTILIDSIKEVVSFIIIIFGFAINILSSAIFLVIVGLSLLD